VNDSLGESNVDGGGEEDRSDGEADLNLLFEAVNLGGISGTY
jgi:hypothetical protein